MKIIVLLIVFSTTAFSQVVVGKPWTFEVGLSSNKAFRNSSCLNLRYVSPRFRWSNEELTVEQEKRIEEFKNTRLMFELLFMPPLKVLGTSFNAQSRIVKYKKLSVDLYGGLKIFFVSGPDFGNIPYLKAGRELWYMNLGLLFQLNLGVISPFADIGGDHIITIGTELNFHKIYKKPKSRYNLHTKPASTDKAPLKKPRQKQSTTR